MPSSEELEKAYLQEITWDEQGNVDSEGRIVYVQFNPETLKVSLSNQVSGDDNKGGAAIQYASRGTSKLAVDLVFDVTSPEPLSAEQAGESLPNDVRKMTTEIALFMKAGEETEGDETKYIPPGVRFQWGSFLFEGVMESMNETLEYFSADGRPLRASVSINLSRQDVDFQILDVNTPASHTPNAGTEPLEQAKDGDTAQSIAARKGSGPNWQSAALANGIENPLRLEVGAFINVRVS